jgi:hypothetical protein
MAAQHIVTDMRRTCFRTEAVVRDSSGGQKIESVYTNEADYVPPGWISEKYSPFVAQLHELRVQVAEADPLIRQLAEGILDGEDKAKGEIARVTRALTVAKEIASQLKVSLGHVREGYDLGLPSLQTPEDFEISCLMNVFDVYEDFAKAIRAEPGSGSEVRSKKAE